MSEKLTKGSDWVVEGNAIAGRGEGRTHFRGLQADLNQYGEKIGFDRVKVDGLIGPQTVVALNLVVSQVAIAQPGLTAGVPPHGTKEEIAENAPGIRGWLLAFARGALDVSPFRRYVRGQGKDWNVKDTIAYGAGEVHEEFKNLQAELNRFADVAAFKPLTVDGFIGPKTAEAVTKVFAALVVRNPLLVATPFPVPDTKEEAAEYASFIRAWLADVAAKNLLAERG
jgi:lysozyme family protein